MVSPWQRLKNLYFWSGVSAHDVAQNPHSAVFQAANRHEMGGQAYIAGFSEEEQSFADSLNKDGRDTKLI